MATADATTIRVFTADDCGRCPAALERVREVASGREGVTVDVFDVEEDRRVALQAGVLSVPTVAIGDERIRGVPARERVERALDGLVE